MRDTDTGGCKRNMKKILGYLSYIGYEFYYVFCLVIGIFARKSTFYKDMWLISERKTDGRDNGYHFFKYMCANHPEINCVFVILKNSPDYEKIKKIGKVIEPFTFSHMLAFACASVRISTHYMGCAPDSYRFAVLKRLNLIWGKDVILRHGITANDLTELHYPNARADLLVCSAVPEYEFMKKNYNYPDGVIQRLGLCRFDRLSEEHEEKNQILIMPTWRYFLRNLTDDEFKKSRYFNEFNKIISNKELHKALDENNFDIVFYLHIELQKFSHLFKSENEHIKIKEASSADVQKLLMESKLLITDYSSIFFDFAYMQKPLLYLQFDEKEFYASQYARGYFNCRRDGFGPVATDGEGAARFILQKLNGNMEPDGIYLERARSFFGEDGKNDCEKSNCKNKHCKKTYEAISKLLN